MEMVEHNNKPKEELVTINGLQFRPYQMQCIEVLARMDGYGNVKEWLNKKIILDLLVPYLEGVTSDFSKEMLEKLKQDGYGR